MTASHTHSYQEAREQAQYLAERDGLIEEWRPRGASELIFIDQMTQAYVLQLHWTETAMLRSEGEPFLKRMFLRTLRQMRDLRRYAPPVIVNHGGQVNVAADGGRQVNIAK